VRGCHRRRWSQSSAPGCVRRSQASSSVPHPASRREGSPSHPFAAQTAANARLAPVVTVDKAHSPSPVSTMFSAGLSRLTQ
jgi:hypothetical protein